MTVTKQKKEEILKGLISSFEKAKTVVFAHYQGTKVKDIRELRKRLHAHGVKFKVAKKTLMQKAVEKVGFKEIPSELMEGPIALAFGMEDEIIPAKTINDFSKSTETIEIVGAIFEGRFISQAEAKSIASLPGKDVLLTQLVGLMMSPISGFHAVLHGLMRNFVYCLSEVQKRKPVVEVPRAEAPKAEAANAEETKPAEAKS